MNYDLASRELQVVGALTNAVIAQRDLTIAFQREEIAKLEADNASLREQLEMAQRYPDRVGEEWA